MVMYLYLGGDLTALRIISKILELSSWPLR